MTFGGTTRPFGSATLRSSRSRFGGTRSVASAGARQHWPHALLLVAVVACAPRPTPAPPQAPPATSPAIAPPNIDDLTRDAWLARRARQLGVSIDEARNRDAALPADVPPDAATDDAQTRAEAAAIWGRVCASCHGLTGRLDGVTQKTDPPPRTWGGMGARMGFFFGGDRMRAGIHRSIAEGGPLRDGKPSPMPAWGTTFAREQIWALVRHIESL